MSSYFKRILITLILLLVFPLAVQADKYTVSPKITKLMNDKKMDFTYRWSPVMTQKSKNSFMEIRKAYEKIPLTDRQKAREILKKAKLNKKLARARQALKLSPYEPAALKVINKECKKFLHKQELEIHTKRYNNLGLIQNVIER